jgi:hypothetical protein
MENKQTAVEWLINEYFGGIENVTPNFRYHIEQAKQMEKEQIMNACGIGFNDGQAYMDGKPKFQSAEQYYNKTYGK